MLKAHGDYSDLQPGVSFLSRNKVMMSLDVLHRQNIDANMDTWTHLFAGAASVDSSEAEFPLHLIFGLTCKPE